MPTESHLEPLTHDMCVETDRRTTLALRGTGLRSHGGHHFATIVSSRVVPRQALYRGLCVLS